MDANQHDRLLTVDELALRWQVTDAWVYRNKDELGIPTVRLGGNVRFAYEDILLFEQSCKQSKKKVRR